MPVDSEIMGDRIETGTLLMACGIAGGEVTLVGARLEHLEIVAMKLGEMGLQVSPTPDGIWARADEPLRAGRHRHAAVPRLRHRLHAARGRAARHRRRHRASSPRTCSTTGSAFVAELNRMGADIRHEGRHAVVRGVDRGSRARRCARSTCAPAPRSCSPGSRPTARPSCSTRFHVDRGYSDLAGSLRALGADVERVRDWR